MQNYFQTQAIGSNKRNRTRSTLLDTAIGVFAEKGISDASIQEITALAGLANGTFYNHFRDKDELAIAASEAIALEIAKQLDVGMNELDRGVSRVVVATWAFIRLAMMSEAWAGVLVEQYQRHPTVQTPAFDYMKADINLAVSQRQIEVKVDNFLLEQIIALMMAAMRRMLNDGRQADLLPRTCENVLRILGLTPSQAAREVERAGKHPLVRIEVSDLSDFFQQRKRNESRKRSA